MTLERLHAYKTLQRDVKLIEIDIERMEADSSPDIDTLQAKRAQLHDKQLETRSVDAWLDSLTGVERFVIRMHCIERYPWRIVVHIFAEEFGERPCKSTLQRIQRKALAK